MDLATPDGRVQMCDDSGWLKHLYQTLIAFGAKESESIEERPHFIPS